MRRVRITNSWSPYANRAAALTLRANRDAPADGVPRRWYSIRAAARVADVYIYNEIGAWGISAQQFAGELAALDVDAITLRINSPGGEVFDGIAIHSVLVNHQATVTVVVDGIAASIASVIAMAGDQVVMNFGSRMMIHDAQGIAFGDATEMTKMATQLEAESDNIAGFYARKAGGTPEEWRDRMKVESWYTADQAVEIGLADRVGNVEPIDGPSPTNTARVPALANRAPVAEPVEEPEPPEPDEWDRIAAGIAGDAGWLRASVREHANNMPDPTPVPAIKTPEPDDEWIVDGTDIINGIRKGLAA